jgi:hypothetical protein
MAFPWVPCAFFGSGESPAKLFVGLWFRQVALNTCHLLLKLVPHRLVDAVDIELRCDVPDKAFEDTVKVLAPALRQLPPSGPRRSARTVPAAPWCACKVVERRHHRVLGQVFTRHAAGACPRVGSFP